MTDIAMQIVQQIKRHPHINRVIVPKVEWLLIKRELRKMTFVRPDKRPTYKGRDGDIARILWDSNFRQWRDFAGIQILGRPVTYRVGADGSA